MQGTSFDAAHCRRLGDQTQLNSSSTAAMRIARKRAKNGGGGTSTRRIRDYRAKQKSEHQGLARIRQGGSERTTGSVSRAAQEERCSQQADAVVRARSINGLANAELSAGRGAEQDPIDSLRSLLSWLGQRGPTDPGEPIESRRCTNTCRIVIKARRVGQGLRLFCAHSSRQDRKSPHLLAGLKQQAHGCPRARARQALVGSRRRQGQCECGRRQT